MKHHQALNSVPPIARKQAMPSAQAMTRATKLAPLPVIARAELVALLARSPVLK
jgi:hypothetical protein